MKNFSKNRYSSDRKRNDGDRQRMHSAVCAACGKNCEVPFRPTGDKPIYCSSCFEKEGGFSANKRDRGERRDYKEEKRMFSATCTDCGVRCEVPFRPTEGKPIYCSRCFENVGSSRSTEFKKPSKTDSDLNKGDIALIRDQLISINSKLEKILLAMKPEEKKTVEEDKKPKEKKQPDKKELKKILTRIESKKTKEKKATTKVQKKGALKK
jgi:CxxC-x17-CxxC domain-containing protein